MLTISDNYYKSLQVCILEIAFDFGKQQSDQHLDTTITGLVMILPLIWM